MVTCFKRATPFIFNNGPVTSRTGKKKRGEGEGRGRDEGDRSVCTGGYEGVQVVRPRYVAGGGCLLVLKM